MTAASDAGRVVAIEYDTALNTAGWTFIEAVGDVGGQLDGRTWNNLKPCLKLTIEKYMTDNALVPAATLSALQRKVEAIGELADEWQGSGRYLHSQIMRDCVMELRAILAADGDNNDG